MMAVKHRVMTFCWFFSSFLCYKSLFLQHYCLLSYSRNYHLHKGQSPVPIMIKLVRLTSLESSDIRNQIMGF